jgi:hypothetical protein
MTRVLIAVVCAGYIVGFAVGFFCAIALTGAANDRVSGVPIADDRREPYGGDPP